jgi:protein required for attachment to host cells
MSKLKIDRGAWVVVCDGAKALVLENVGDEKFPNLRTKEVYEQEDPKTSEQGTDVPGRAINSVGNIRSAVEQTDWHEAAERAFLGKLVERLAAAAHAGEAKAIILVAPPRALGMIRPRYTPALKAALKAEVDKDLTKHPVDQIERHLTVD